MKIFLSCNRDGYVIEAVAAKTFQAAYKDTIGLNNGEFLVEIDKQVFREIENLQKTLKIFK